MKITETDGSYLLWRKHIKYVFNYNKVFVKYVLMSVHRGVSSYFYKLKVKLNSSSQNKKNEDLNSDDLWSNEYAVMYQQGVKGCRQIKGAVLIIRLQYRDT